MYLFINFIKWLDEQVGNLKTQMGAQLYKFLIFYHFLTIHSSVTFFITEVFSIYKSSNFPSPLNFLNIKNQPTLTIYLINSYLIFNITLCTFRNLFWALKNSNRNLSF